MSVIITGDWDDVDAGDNTPEKYVLRLYTAGASSNSLRAIENIKAICEDHLTDRYELEIVDVRKDAASVAQEQIIALPLLVRMAPKPERRLIGDMSNTEKVLRGLGLA